MLKSKYIFFFILFFIVFAYYLISINNELGIYGDDAGYIIWAKSLLTGGGLDYINEPQPRSSGFRLFFLPALLTLIALIKDAVWAYKIIPAFFSALTIIALYIFLKQYNLNKITRLFILILFLVNPLFYEYSHQIMTENIFVCLSLLTLLAAEKLVNSQSIKSKISILLLLSLLLLLTYMTRAASIALIIGIILYIFYKRYIITAVILILLAILTILAFNKLFAQKDFEERYISIFKMKSQYTPESGERSIADMLKFIPRKILVYSLRLTADMFCYPIFTNVKVKTSIDFLLQIFIGSIISFLIILGFWLKNFGDWKANKNLKLNAFDLYVLISILMLLLWQVYSSRYLLPLLPFFCIYIIIAAQRLLNFNRLSVFRYFIFCFIYLLLIFGLIGQFLSFIYARNNKLPDEWRYYYSALDIILKDMQTADIATTTTKKNKIVVCRKPLSYYIKANAKIKTIGYPLTTDINAMHQFFKTIDIDYLVVDSFNISGANTAEMYLLPYLKQYLPFYEIIYTNQQCKVLKLKK